MNVYDDKTSEPLNTEAREKARRLLEKLNLPDARIITYVGIWHNNDFLEKLMKGIKDASGN